MLIQRFAFIGELFYSKVMKEQDLNFTLRFLVPISPFLSVNGSRNSEVPSDVSSPKIQNKCEGVALFMEVSMTNNCSTRMNK